MSSYTLPIKSFCIQLVSQGWLHGGAKLDGKEYYNILCYHDVPTQQENRVSWGQTIDQKEYYKILCYHMSQYNREKTIGQGFNMQQEQTVLQNISYKMGRIVNPLSV